MYIKITDVNKTIKKAPILRDINLEFTGGKVYGLRGKNGSGKTMLMRVICGLISATEGTVEIDGKILGKDMTFPDSVGVLIENPAFIGNYTGFKNLKVLASIQNRVDDEHIREVIRQVGLDPDDKRTYRKYSLGMKQKLGIAASNERWNNKIDGFFKKIACRDIRRTEEKRSGNNYCMPR